MSDRNDLLHYREAASNMFLEIDRLEHVNANLHAHIKRLEDLNCQLQNHLASARDRNARLQAIIDKQLY